MSCSGCREPASSALEHVHRSLNSLATRAPPQHAHGPLQLQVVVRRGSARRPTPRDLSCRADAAAPVSTPGVRTRAGLRDCTSSSVGREKPASGSIQCWSTYRRAASALVAGCSLPTALPSALSPGTTATGRGWGAPLRLAGLARHQTCDPTSAVRHFRRFIQASMKSRMTSDASGRNEPRASARFRASARTAAILLRPERRTTSSCTPSACPPSAPPLLSRSSASVLPAIRKASVPLQADYAIPRSSFVGSSPGVTVYQPRRRATRRDVVDQCLPCGALRVREQGFRRR